MSAILTSDVSDRFGMPYLCNQRHLQGDESEMKRWMITGIQHLVAEQCQVIGGWKCITRNENSSLAQTCKSEFVVLSMTDDRIPC